MIEMRAGVKPHAFGPAAGRRALEKKVPDRFPRPAEQSTEPTTNHGSSRCHKSVEQLEETAANTQAEAQV